MTDSLKERIDSYTNHIVKAVIILTPFLVWAAKNWLSVELTAAVDDIRINQIRMEEQIKIFIGAGPRYTPDMAKAENLQLKHDILEIMDAGWPPARLLDDVSDLRDRVRALESNGQ